MRGFSYIITRDYGFAPNPFGGYCTLATCKPRIRRQANIGDWVIALGSRQQNLGGTIVCLMKVTEMTTFDEYWNDPRFQYKKPNLNGTLVQMWGDNIYHSVNGKWVQEDSHHSYADGTVNPHNLKKDTGTTDSVLISEEFYYFGATPLPLKRELFEAVDVGINHRVLSKGTTQAVCNYVASKAAPGIISDPMWYKKVERYDGQS
jgi:hypothetical protein